MVCCFAKLQYACHHVSDFKIGCTNDCNDSCEPREDLLVAKSVHRCESCITAKCELRKQELYEQQDQLRAKQELYQRQDLLRDRNYAKGLEGFETLLICGGNVQRRAKVNSNTQRDLPVDLGEKVEGSFRELATRADCVKKLREYDLDCSERWTNEYAENIWQLKYAECVDEEGFKMDLSILRRDPICQVLTIVHESRWDADYAEENHDTIVPPVGSSTTAAPEATDLLPGCASDTSSPGPAARELTAESPFPAAQLSPPSTLPAALEPAHVEDDQFSDRVYLPRLSRWPTWRYSRIIQQCEAELARAAARPSHEDTVLKTPAPTQARGNNLLYGELMSPLPLSTGPDPRFIPRNPLSTSKRPSEKLPSPPGSPHPKRHRQEETLPATELPTSPANL